MEGANPPGSIADVTSLIYRDDAAYVYRLCLEYARLWSDDRDSMNFTL